jgi:hypothetical protein
MRTTENAIKSHIKRANNFAERAKREFYTLIGKLKAKGYTEESIQSALLPYLKSLNDLPQVRNKAVEDITSILEKRELDEQ